MRTKTLNIDDSGTMLKVKVSSYHGEYEATQTISIYEDKGELVVYTLDKGVFRIPLKEAKQ